MSSTSFTVHVVRRRFAAEITTPDAASSRLLRRVVPSAGREWLPETRAWLVHGSRLPALLAAFEAAGIPVEVADVVSPSGGRPS